MDDSLQYAIPVWPAGYTAEKSKTHHVCEYSFESIQFTDGLSSFDVDNSGQIVGSGEWLPLGLSAPITKYLINPPC